jgi:phage anti-repressor protein
MQKKDNHMNLKVEIPILSISISSETTRVNACELYDFLGCKKPFKEWIEELIDGYKGYHNYIVIKEPAIGSKADHTLMYYINLKLAKIAALRAGSKEGRQAYDYFKGYNEYGL